MSDNETEDIFMNPNDSSSTLGNMPFTPGGGARTTPGGPMTPGLLSVPTPGGVGGGGHVTEQSQELGSLIEQMKDFLTVKRTQRGDTTRGLLSEIVKEQQKQTQIIDRLKSDSVTMAKKIDKTNQKLKKVHKNNKNKIKDESKISDNDHSGTGKDKNKKPYVFAFLLFFFEIFFIFLCLLC